MQKTSHCLVNENQSVKNITGFYWYNIVPLGHLHTVLLDAFIYFMMLCTIEVNLQVHDPIIKAKIAKKYLSNRIQKVYNKVNSESSMVSPQRDEVDGDQIHSVSFHTTSHSS